MLNPKDHPDAKTGDVVEIYHPEDESTRLLLQITCFNEDIKGTRGTCVHQLFRCLLSPQHMIIKLTNLCDNPIFRSNKHRIKHRDRI